MITVMRKNFGKSDMCESKRWMSNPLRRVGLSSAMTLAKRSQRWATKSALARLSLPVQARVFRWFAALAGFRVRVLGPEERDKARRLCFQIYCEEGHVDPGLHPRGMLVDDYDECSTYFLLSDARGRPIGTARLVRGSELGFPTEDIFSIRLPEQAQQSQTAEIGRLAILGEHRRRFGGVAFLTMMASLYLWSTEQGIRQWVCCTMPGLARAVRRFGGESVEIRTPDHGAAYRTEALDFYTTTYLARAKPYMIKLPGVS